MSILNKQLRNARNKELKDELHLKELIKDNKILKDLNNKVSKEDLNIDVKFSEIKQIINFKYVIQNILKSNKLNEIEKIHKIYDIVRE